jgi:hypothetical protein
MGSEFVVSPFALSSLDDNAAANGAADIALSSNDDNSAENGATE